MFFWYIGHIRSPWRFSPKKLLKITHLLVLLVQISVTETRWLESFFYDVAMVSKLLNSLVWPRYRVNIQSGKIIALSKSPILSINSSTHSLFPFILPSFSHSRHVCFTHCPSVQVLCNSKGRLTQWHRQVKFRFCISSPKPGLSAERKKGFYLAANGNTEENLHYEEWSDKKQVMAGISNWLLHMQSFLSLYFYSWHSYPRPAIINSTMEKAIIPGSTRLLATQ